MGAEIFAFDKVREQNISRATEIERLWWTNSDFDIKNNSELEKLTSDGKLLKIETNPLLGYVISEKMTNKLATRELKKFIDDLSFLWKKGIQKKGLDTEKKFLLITSIIRTREQQRSLVNQNSANAVENSTHTKGKALDISTWFFNKPEGKEYGKILSTILQRLKNQNLINWIKEGSKENGGATWYHVCISRELEEILARKSNSNLIEEILNYTDINREKVLVAA